jgi:hypothetical protein
MSDWASPAIMTQNSSAPSISVTQQPSKLPCCATIGFVRLCAAIQDRRREQRTDAEFIRYLGALLVVSATLGMLGCATAHATLSFRAPSTATAGVPFTVTVNVIYQGKPDTVINSAIQFSSSDPAAILPPAYYFTPTDAGSHTWTNGFTLSTPGTQTISGSIHDASGINGSAIVSVSP